MRILCSLCLLAFLCLAALPAGAETEIVLTFGGDCVLGTREEWQKDPENFNAQVEALGPDGWFANLLPVFQQDDMTFVNLEGVLKNDGKNVVKDKEYRFRGPTTHTEILRQASVEQVNIANNHIIDYGKAGRASTLKALQEAGIFYSGYGELYVFEKDGYKIGFGGCRETLFRQNRRLFDEDIQKLQDLGCDVILYSFHWGEEYSPKHNALQQKMARYAIDKGVDIIVGTHPHCVQGIAKYKGAPVLYSLGNLLFGGTHEMTTFDAYIAQATLRFDEAGYQGVELQILPVLTSSDIPRNNFQPILAEGKDHQRIMKLIQKDSTLKIKETMWFEAQRNEKK